MDNIGRGTIFFFLFFSIWSIRNNNNNPSMSETVNSKKDNVTIYHRHSESLRIYLYRFVCVCECACVFGICSSDGLSAVTIFFVPMCVQQTTLAVCLLAFETKVFEGLEVRSWSTSYRCHVWCSWVHRVFYGIRVVKFACPSFTFQPALFIN